MKNLYFKMRLLTDVIINQRAATEGNQKTLDFIPGNAFLGVAATTLYNNDPEESFVLFHSGKVRFGDAHPVVEGKRALKVPASWFQMKDDKENLSLYVHHGLDKNGLKINGNPIQIRQLREGYIVKLTDNQVSKVKINKHFAIKSAYDSEKRRSEDAKMFGYESLEAGSEWCFEVVVDDDLNPKLLDGLVQSLVGKRRIGRSSTAQYGLVEISKLDDLTNGFSEWDRPQTRDEQQDVVFLYAESRLIFIDKYGQPTFTPTIEQLGFTTGEICWDMSQVRTFQYAPYNGTRKTRDADRMGIEKGSVICIKGATCSEIQKWVGSYQNEGFGKVLVNPDFLAYENAGEARFRFDTSRARDEKKPVKARHEGKFTGNPDTLVWSYLERQSSQTELQKDIYKKVNAFVDSSFGKSFVGKEKFASQWGTIRSIALQIRQENLKRDYEKEKQLLLSKLFTEKDSVDKSTGKTIPVGYLKHGVGFEKWEFKAKELEKFIKELNAETTIEIMINLAAEMAKKCRRD